MIPGMAALVGTVQRNCNIADARHARDVTLCTYLLGMREFYRWEHDIPYGVAPPRTEVGRWISEREALWEEIAEHEFAPLSIAGSDFDPFDAPAINDALSGSGLVYGGGIGRFGKPHFFLARLAREEQRGGAHLLICDCEYARDITAMPAALQNDTIVVRREALRQWLWEKAEGWSVKRQEGTLKRALDAYAFDADPARAIEHMTDAETETLALHEEGEYRAGQLLGPEWGLMLAGFDRKRPELLARAVRDNLADCLVTLPTLIERQAWPSLHLWFASFDGMRRELFPALVAEAQKVGADGTAPGLIELVVRGQEHWLQLARRLPQLDQNEVEQLSHRTETIAL
jgi:hypothetical protein